MLTANFESIFASITTKQIILIFIGMIILFMHQTFWHINAKVKIEIVGNQTNKNIALNLIKSEAHEVYKKRRNLINEFCMKYLNDSLLKDINENLRWNTEMWFDYQTIKERRSYERRSERRSQFHERDLSTAHIFNRECKKSAAHSISY